MTHRSLPFRTAVPAGLLTLLLAPLLAADAARPASASAQETTPTRLVVRVVAHDAKVIGSGVGGARVTVRDAATGQVLTEGVQEGGTGDTGAIMGARERGATVFDIPGTGSFAASLDLSEPTRVVIEAEGPLGTPHATQHATKTVLLVPGEHLDGEGVVLELNGFTVELLEPGDALAAAGSGDATRVPVRARVTMLCGCPIEPGGLWDADGMEVRARLLRDGHEVDTTVLDFAGETSVFAGALEASAPGSYTVRVIAVDADRANTGMAERAVAVRDGG